MEHRSALTLKPGDVITIPGVGTRLVGAVDQLDFDRYQIRLDEKFVESIIVGVVTNGEQRTPERHVSRRGADRIHSRNPDHFRQDLSSSLEFVLGDDYVAHIAVVQEIIGLLHERRGNEEALVAVKTQLGTHAFGKVLRYHLENKTSLSNDAEVLTSTRSLARLGMTVADLDWPDEVLNPVYRSGE